MSKRPGIDKDISKPSLPENVISTQALKDEDSVVTNSDVNKQEKENEINEQPLPRGPGPTAQIKTANETVDKLMTSFEYNQKLTRSIVNDVLKQDKLKTRADIGDLVLHSLNVWSEPFKLISKSRVIVSEIPSIVKFKRTATQDVDRDVIHLLGGQFAADLPVIRDSMILFSSNTDRVSYYINTTNTRSKLLYDPEKQLDTTLKLHSFVVTGQDGESRDDPYSRARTFGELLQLILELRIQGDVFIQGIESTKVGDYTDLRTSVSLDLLRGKSIPKNGMVEHIALGVHAHSLNWFARDVRESINYDNVEFGEYSTISRMVGTNAKKSSYYAVSVDHLIATLHHYYMLEHELKKADAKTYCDAVRLLAYEGSTIRELSDAEADIYEVYQPNEDDTNAYMFMFFVSQPFRAQQYSYLLKQITLMGGVRVKTAADRLRLDNNGLDPFNLATNIEESLLRYIRGYTIEHFRQMMIIELSHRFHDASYLIPTSFSTFQDAIFALLSIAMDAIVFPNFFWNNIHIYGTAFYRAWQYLSLEDFQKMMTHGFTESYNSVRNLTKADIRQGEIPKAFKITEQMPNAVKNFIRSIRPVGVLHDRACFRSTWCGSVDSSPQFYIPFEFRDRPLLGTVTETPVFDAIFGICGKLKALVTQYGVKNNQSRSATTPMNQLLTTLSTWGRSFGTLCHYEMHAIYKHLCNGPEIPSTTYKGKTEPDVSKQIGIGSTLNSTVGIPSRDTTTQVFPGIGLWALCSLIGNEVNSAGDVVDKNNSTIVFPDPGVRYNDYVNTVQNIRRITEPFGIMSYILDGENAKNSSLKYLVDGFGSSLKSGVAAQILEWMLQGTDVRSVISGDLISRDSPLFIDQRLYAPRITLLDSDGTILPPSETDTNYMKYPLILLDRYAKSKLEVCAEVIAGSNSPLHRYVKGVVIAKTTFDEYTPENRHPDPNIEIVYKIDSEDFGFELIGDETKVYFKIDGRKWHGKSEVGFPENVRIIIENPIEVTDPYWNFIEIAMENAGWQIYLNKLDFIVSISSVTHDMAKSLHDNGHMDWKFIKNYKLGQVVRMTLYDTSSDLVNNRKVVMPAGVIQNICTVDPVERNVAVRGIVGFNKNKNYSGVDKRMWEIGYRNPEQLPTVQKIGLPKYKLPVMNFNNFLKVYSNNMDLNEMPKYKYLPPVKLGQ